MLTNKRQCKYLLRFMRRCFNKRWWNKLSSAFCVRYMFIFKAIFILFLFIIDDINVVNDKYHLVQDEILNQYDKLNVHLLLNDMNEDFLKNFDP